MEQYDRAFERSVELVRKYVDFPPLYEAIAELGLYTRDWARSERVFVEQIREGTEVPLALYALAFSKASQDDHAGAVRLCLEAIEGGLSYSGVFKELAYAYENAYGHEEAMSMLGRLSRSSPRSAGLHYAVALGLWSKGDFGPVIAHLREAVALDPAQACYGDALAVADLHLGYSWRKAQYVELRRRLARSRGDIAGSQFLASSLVSDQIYAGDRRHHSSILQESTAEASEFGFVRWLGWSRQRLADARSLESRFPEALQHAMLARSLGLRANDYSLVMVATQRISSAYLETGILDSALLYAQMRWSLTSRNKSASDYTTGLSRIALILCQMGHLQLANEYSVEALAEADSRIVDPVTLAEIETTYGIVQERLGNMRAATRHHLLAQKALQAENPLPYCMAANAGNLGRARMAEGYGRLALGLFEQELRIATNLGYRTEIANAQLNIGDLAFASKDQEKSRVCYLQALKIAREIGSILLEFESLNRLARMSAACNELEGSLEYYIELERVGIALLLNGRTVFPDFVSALKEKAHLELSHGKWLAGLATLKATKLVELHPYLVGAEFRSSGQFSRLGASMFRRAREDRAAALERLREQIEKRTASLSSRSAELSAMSEVVDAQLAISRIVRDQARGSLPVWASGPREGSLRDIAISLGARSLCVIHYLVREEETDVFCMTSDTTVYRRLHVTRKRLEEAVHLMSPVLRKGGLRVPLLHPSMADFDLQSAHELYQILVEPMLPFMSRTQRLVIVPDAFLAYVPFDALVSSIGARDSMPSFLIRDFEVSYCWYLDQLELHSASAAAGASLLVVANPETQAEDRGGHGIQGVQSVNFMQQAVRRDLPGSQDEATLIRGLLGGKVRLLMREEATKEKVLGLLSGFSMIHLATHSVTDELQPDFVGLALGSAISDSGDGVLRLFELQPLELDADLVVLNGCNTARGADMSPAWNPVSAFIAAGSRSAIGTLWDVQDEASRRLICDFYAGVKGGVRAAAALRRAKLNMISGGKSHPVQWASHILMGNPEIHLDLSQAHGDVAVMRSRLCGISVCSCVCASCLVALICLTAALGRMSRPNERL